LLGVGDWRAHLAAIRDATPRRPVALVDRELAQWRAALEPDALLGRPIGERRRTAARAATFVRSMSLGWIRHPVLAEIYARHGLTREASQHRADAMRSVNRITLGAVLFILAALGGLALWCMGGFALAIIGRPSIMRHVAGLPALPPMLSRALAIAAASYFAGIVAVRFAVGLLPERAIAWLSADAATTARFGLSSAIAVLALVPPLVVLRRSGVGHLPTWQAIGLVRTRPFRDMAVGLSGYMAVLPPLIVTVLVSMRLFSESESRMNPAVVDFVASPSIWPRLMLLLAGSVVAPLTEELVFRGILVRALQANLGVLGAIVVSSAIFAVLHPQLPMGFLSIFVLGLAFSALYWLTGSLWPSIIAHAVNNTIVFGYLALMLSD
jgi:membrane protease YdiL (CAAX protease family)